MIAIAWVVICHHQEMKMLQRQLQDHQYWGFFEAENGLALLQSAWTNTKQDMNKQKNNKNTFNALVGVFLR